MKKSRLLAQAAWWEWGPKFRRGEQMAIVPDQGGHVNIVARRLWGKVIELFPDFARWQDLQHEGTPLPNLSIEFQRMIIGSLCGPHFSRAVFLVLESMIEAKIRQVLRDEGVID